MWVPSRAKISAVAGFEDGRGGDGGTGLMETGDDLLQVGVGAFNQLGDQLDILHVEDDLTAIGGRGP